MKRNNQDMINTLNIMCNVYIDHLKLKKETFNLIINDEDLFQTKETTINAQIAGASNVTENIINFINNKQFSFPKNSKIVLKKVFGYCLNCIDSLQLPFLFDSNSIQDISEVEQKIENKRLEFKSQMNCVYSFLKTKDLI